MTENIRQIPAKDTYTLRHDVMWPNMPVNYIILPNDEEGIHFGLFVNDALMYHSGGKSLAFRRRL